MHKPLLATVFAVATCFACAASPPAHADSAKGKTDSSSDLQLPPLPAAASRTQRMVIDGRTLNYTVTIGWLPVRDGKGKTIAQVVYTAYTVPGENRPVTFAFNGGPGAASVFLNLGAIGPKTVNFGVNGDSPSEPARLHDNPSTWLPFTDLVFIDPVGTGYSRSLVDDKQ
ncbi:MAG TPA: peptidase S10, partial [Rhodanobacteraceae bacterium]